MFLFVKVFSANGQSLLNLRIGDDVSRLTLLDIKPSTVDTYKSFSVRKWTLSTGNDLSVTTSSSGGIVYLESDWNGRTADSACDLPGLKFGVTTLGDLRKRFGSNGFGFEHRPAIIQLQDGIAMTNSYEVGTNIVTFITKVGTEFLRLKESGQSGSIADHASLDAISIAAVGYAKDEWGDRIYDPNYKKIDWK